MCNNLHKKNANYRKKCIFLVQNRICDLLGVEVDENYKFLGQHLLNNPIFVHFHKWLIFSLIYENSVIWRCFVR